jgi:Zn-dependent protease with chaperone function
MLDPLIGVVVGVVAAGLLRRWVAPATATRLLTVVAVSSAVAVGWALLLVVFAWAIAYPQFSEVTTWCQIATPGHHPVGTGVGLGALVVLLIGTTRACCATRRFRRADAEWVRSDPLEIVSAKEPLAFSVPGKPGSVVVSTGLLNELGLHQCDAVLAHEQAHLAHSHHRYLRITRVATVAVPLLAPLERWVGISAERWADEEAALTIGDRGTVASALIATATATAKTDGALHFNRSHLEERVDALVNPRQRHPYAVGAALAVVWAAVAATLVANSAQLQHLAAFAEHVCANP